MKRRTTKSAKTRQSVPCLEDSLLTARQVCIEVARIPRDELQSNTLLMDACRLKLGAASALIKEADVRVKAVQVLTRAKQLDVPVDPKRLTLED